MSMYEKLKKIDPLTLDEYTGDLWQLTYEQGIELTYIYIEKLINRIPIDKKIKLRWHKLNRKNREIYLSPTRIHILRTTTGSGKTVTSVLWAKFLTQLCSKIEGFVVLSAEYEFGTNEIERIIIKHGNQVDYIKFEGMIRLCTQLETQINNNGTTIGELKKFGISIKPYCEDECEDSQTCRYRENCIQTIKPIKEGGIKTWIGVQHQLGAFFPIFLYHSEEIILIIDEEFSDAVKAHYIYNIPILRKNLIFLTKVLTELEPDDGLYLFITEFMKFIEKLITSNFDYIEKRIIELEYTVFINIMDNIIEAKGDSDVYVIRLNEIAFDYIKNKKIPPFKFIFSEINNFIENYKDLKKYVNKDIKKWIKSAFYIKNNKYTFLYYNRQLLKYLLGKDKILKLIINDATAEKIQLEYLISDIEPIEDHFEDWGYENCEIHQLKKPIQGNKHGRTYAHYGKTSFFQYPSSKSTFNYVIGDLKLILELHKDEPVLIGSRNIKGEKLKDINGGIALSNFIQTLGHSNTNFVEYPVKGTNEFSDINVVVVLMNPDLPHISIKRQSALWGIDQKTYRETYSKNNIIQFIGRIFRGNEHKYIYIIPAVSIPSLIKRKEYYTYRSHSELRNYLKKQIKIKNDKKDKEEKYNKIKEYLEIHKFLTVKSCIELLKITDYKSKKLLEEFTSKKLLNKGNLRNNQKGRTKIIYYINSD